MRPLEIVIIFVFNQAFGCWLLSVFEVTNAGAGAERNEKCHLSVHKGHDSARVRFPCVSLVTIIDESVLGASGTDFVETENGNQDNCNKMEDSSDLQAGKCELEELGVDQASKGAEKHARKHRVHNHVESVHESPMSIDLRVYTFLSHALIIVKNLSIGWQEFSCFHLGLIVGIGLKVELREV